MTTTVNTGTALPDATPISVATDLIGGVHTPISKAAFGAAGTVVQVSQANPLPVVPLLNTDSFGRLRVCSPGTILDAKMTYDTQPFLYETATESGGTVTHLPNEGSALLAVTGASGSSVIRQTRVYVPYQPGKSRLIYITCAFGTAVANVRKRVGYFEEQNGIFLEQNGATLNIVRRSYTTGNVVDTVVPQVQWSVDAFGGAGPSGVTLDAARVQILVIDLQWLGAGRVRVGFDVDGVIYWAHEFLHANYADTAYMSTGTLPVRYEITCTGASSPSSMRQICFSVQSEDGMDLVGSFPFGAGRITTVPVTARRPVLSIRAADLYLGLPNHCGILIDNFDLIASSVPVLVEAVYGGTLTGASWASAGATSSVEYDQAATAIAGGITVWAGVCPAGGAKADQKIDAKPTGHRWLTSTHLPTAAAGPSLALVCTRIGASGTADVAAAWRWSEAR